MQKAPKREYQANHKGTYCPIKYLERELLICQESAGCHECQIWIDKYRPETGKQEALIA